MQEMSQKVVSLFNIHNISSWRILGEYFFKTKKQYNK